MLTYLYDGSLEGLLTVLAVTLGSNEAIAAITPQADFQPDLFSDICEVKTNSTIAQQFFAQLQAKYSQMLVLDLVNCLIAEIAGLEIVIYNFIRLLLTHGETIIHNLVNPTVFKIHRVSEQVNHEIQRLHGFVRFRRLTDGVYYAAIEPDYNVVRLLASHFTARFNDQQWLIHDLKRDTGIYYDGAICRFLPEVCINPETVTASSPFTTSKATASLAPKESAYQSIWNQYFQAIAIPERTNPRAQRQRMPQRYWKHLVEQVET